MSYLRGPLSRDQIRTLTALDGPRRRPIGRRGRPPAAGARTGAGSARPADASSSSARRRARRPAVLRAGAAPATPLHAGGARRRARDVRRPEAADQRDARHRRGGADRRWRRAVDWPQARGPRRRRPATRASPAEGAHVRPAAASRRRPRRTMPRGRSRSRHGSPRRRRSILRATPRLQLTSKIGRIGARLPDPRAERAAARRATPTSTSVRQKFAAKRARAGREAAPRRTGRHARAAAGDAARSCRPPSRSARPSSARCSAARAISAGTIGRATTAARGFGRSAKEMEDVQLAQENADGDASGAGRPRRADRRGDEGHRRALRRGRREHREDRPSPPNAGQVTVQFVALGWKAK